MTMRDKEQSTSLLAALRLMRQLFSRREKIGFLLLLLSMMGGAFMEMLSLGAIPLFISLATNPERILNSVRVAPLLETLNIGSPHALIIWAAGALIVIFVFRTAYMIGLTYATVRFTQTRQLRLMDRLFTAYMHAPYTFHLQRNSSELLRNVRDEIYAVINHVLQPLLSLSMHGIMTAAVLALLFTREPGMAFLSLLLFGIAGGGYEMLLKRRLLAHGKDAQAQRSQMVKNIQQGLGVLKEARVLQRETYFTRRFRASAQRIIQAERFSHLAGRMTAPYMECLAIVGLLGIGMGLVALGRDVNDIAPTLALFAAAFVRLKAGAMGILGSFTGLRYHSVSIFPVFNDLQELRAGSTARNRRQPQDLTPFQRLAKDVRLQDVRFRYPGAESDTIGDVNLVIQQGQSVAFVGPSGGGKTTLVDLMMGLITPSEGAVLVDQTDIREQLSEWQRQIGYIPQNIYLVDDSIRRNIALGIEDNDIVEAQVRAVLRDAQLETFVDSLPQGLDTIIGERGVRLSGGQRQRIGIARALYHNPELIVMDEATAALDNDTERDVLAAVNQLKGTRTIIMIAHRLTTVAECDHVYRVCNGSVQPAELSKNGLSVEKTK